MVNKRMKFYLTLYFKKTITDKASTYFSSSLQYSSFLSIFAFILDFLIYNKRAF